MATPRSAREGRGLVTSFTAVCDPFPLLQNRVWLRETRWVVHSNAGEASDS